MSDLDLISLVNGAASQLLIPRPERRFKRWRPEEDEYLRQEWLRHTPAQEIAKALIRSVGVIRQRIFHNHKDLHGKRVPGATRLVRKHGHAVLQAGGTPAEAAAAMKAAKVLAYADAKASATKAKQARYEVALSVMRSAIANGGDRDMAIFVARAEGVRLEALGKEFKITRERIRQICEKVAFTISLEAQLKNSDERARLLDQSQPTPAALAKEPA